MLSEGSFGAETVCVPHIKKKNVSFQISSYFNSYIISFLKSFLKKWFTARTDTVLWFLVLIPDPYNLYPRHQIFNYTAYHCPQNRWGSASSIRTVFWWKLPAVVRFRWRGSSQFDSSEEKVKLSVNTGNLPSATFTGRRRQSSAKAEVPGVDRPPQIPFATSTVSRNDN